jgi:hypothetical protein
MIRRSWSSIMDSSYYEHNQTEAGSDFDRAYELAPELLQAQIGKAISEGFIVTRTVESHGSTRRSAK